MPKIYGRAPDDLGLLDINPTEMLFWLYCPVKLPNTDGIILPPNLQQFSEFVEACWEAHDPSDWYKKYVYLTAKTLWCTPDSTGQREGWHCDGYLTSDVNYIWANSEPTVFAITEQLVEFSGDHSEALKEMDFIGNQSPNVTYDLKHILRMDQTVLHRVADFKKSGMRSFLKLTVSENQFNLKGNSVNHQLPAFNYDVDRKEERNTERSTLQDFAKKGK